MSVIDMGLLGQKGQAIILVTLLVLMVTTTVLASLTLCEKQRTVSNYRREKVQAYYYADAGIERVLAKLNAGPEWIDSLKTNNCTLIYDDENVKVKVKKQPNIDKTTLHIKSTGYYKQGKQTMKAEISLGETVQVLSWEEKYLVLPN